ncbi:MAG TPA: DNA polymerase/3'-5' exonuclease PolX [Vicinamibacterales bacterium]|jgi:DNA polymerase (family 10)|nr:DNA polymerase/3'-5' exonuclease PolX [Vicinamibacterales bacterium]
MENVAIARIFSEIADLLEIKNENPFKIRAYRNAADTVAHATDRLSACSDAQLRAMPGIGKELAAKIREVCETGGAKYHRDLLDQFPPTILDLLHLQGVGPKTVAQLYTQLGIRTLEELEAGCKDGRIRELKGMGPRKEALILKALEERKQRSGRHLLPDAAEAGALLVAYMREEFPAATFTLVGSIRRGAETPGDIDVLATGADPGVMAAFTSYRLVERVLGQGDTKSSVLLRGGIQADLRVVAAESRGAALQYFTGSKSHNIALRDRAMARGYKLNEYGLFRVSDGVMVAAATEEDIYEALDLALVPPELREGRDEIEAAAQRALPLLVELGDIRGDIHAHTSETDGREDIETMALAAREAGLSYLAITDHSKALAMANGLDEPRALAHARRVREISSRLEGITLLAGIECDIRPDGTMDLEADCLAQLDVVVASVHSAFNQDESQMTDRVLKAIECPYVDILGHPTGRRLLKREGYKVNINRMIDAAAAAGVALEINCLAERLDLCDTHAKLARDRGAKIVISTDSHSPRGFQLLKWGVIVARRAWLSAADVLNTRPVDEFRAGLRRNKGKVKS